MHTDFRTTLVDYVLSSHAMLAVLTNEKSRAIEEIVAAAEQIERPVHVWNIAIGWQDSEGKVSLPQQGLPEPDVAVQEIMKLPEGTLAILKDFGPYVRYETCPKSDVVCGWLEEIKSHLYETGKIIIFVGPELTNPTSLRHDITHVEFELPDAEQIERQVRYVCEGVTREDGSEFKPDEQMVPEIVAACKGMTQQQTIDRVALALRVHKGLNPEAKRLILHEKAGLIRQSGVLTYQEPPTGGLDAVGGLEALKEHVRLDKPTFGEEAREFGIEYPKGVLLVGLPGCLHGDTPIVDPVAGTCKTVKERWRDGVPFHVWAMGQDGPVPALALPPQRYGMSPMIEFHTGNGHTITVTPQHRFWTGRRWIYASEVFERLQASSPVLLASSSGICQSTRPAGARHWTRRVQGSLDDCQRDRHSCDVRPHRAVAVGRSFAPSPVGVRGCSRSSRPGGLAGESSHTHACRAAFRHSTPNSSRLSIARMRTGRLGLAHSPDEEPHRLASKSFPESSPLAPASGPTDIAQWPAPVFHQPISPACQVNTPVVSAHLVSPEPYFDFHVPFYENYWACGLLHHNCGKTATTLAIASKFALPLVKFDVGSVMSKYVGESEGQVREAIRLMEAIAPCVVQFDEIEKGFGGVGDLDGGASQRVFGTVLKWLNDRSAPVYIVATANRVQSLPPEFMRKGRFDELFFVDLPNEDERVEIIRIHLTKRRRDPARFDIPEIVKATEGFTGSDIEQAVKMGLKLAFAEKKELTTDHCVRGAASIVPLTKTEANRIEEIRSWCSTRAKPANRTAAKPTKPSRRINVSRN